MNSIEKYRWVAVNTNERQTKRKTALKSPKKRWLLLAIVWLLVHIKVLFFVSIRRKPMANIKHTQKFHSILFLSVIEILFSFGYWGDSFRVLCLCWPFAFFIVSLSLLFDDTFFLHLHPVKHGKPKIICHICIYWEHINHQKYDYHCVSAALWFK